MSGIMSVFVGSASADKLTLTSRTVDDTVGQSTASAQYQLTTGGIAQSITINGGTVTLENWVVPATSSSRYEVFATLIAGTLTTGTTGTWQALTSTRGWSRNRTTVGTNTAIINLAIRLVGTTTTLVTADITLSATYQP